MSNMLAELNYIQLSVSARSTTETLAVDLILTPPSLSAMLDLALPLFGLGTRRSDRRDACVELASGYKFGRTARRIPVDKLVFSSC